MRGGWKELDAVRCARCSVYAESSEILLAPDGTTYCAVCGPPEPDVSVGPRWSRETFRSAGLRTAKNPTALVAALMTLTTFGFLFAACASQL